MWFKCLLDRKIVVLFDDLRPPVIISNNILAQYIHMVNYSFHPFLSVRKVFFISLA